MYRRPSMQLLERIELDPRVCNGKAVIQGTRIPVSAILDQVASGESWDDIVKGFPELKKDDIQAALLYASALLDLSEVKEVHA
jgi:uncharacterized protein (DUF433 family)